MSPLQKVDFRFDFFLGMRTIRMIDIKRDYFLLIILFLRKKGVDN